MHEALALPFQRRQHQQQWQVQLLSPLGGAKLPLEGVQRRQPKQRVQQQWEVQLHEPLPYPSAWGEGYYLL
jgi:hypothetical protein